MRPRNELAALSRDVCLNELASILAAAILRLRSRAVLATEDDSEVRFACLEVPPETVLSGHRG